MRSDPARTLTPDDQVLERAIDQAYRALVAGGTGTRRRQAWRRLRDLVEQRSAREVARLERERGLR